MAGMAKGPLLTFEWPGSCGSSFSYPSTLLSFYKKENDFWCCGSLRKGSKHTRAGLGTLH